METDFYTFYKSRLGLLSEKVFGLFWTGEFSDCYNLLAGLSNSFGSPLALGQEALLIYNYCSLIYNKDILTGLDLPPPPLPTEVEALAKYEGLLEGAKVTFTKKRSFGVLHQPKILSKALLVANLGIEENCSNIIETGTFLGQSSYLFSGSFKAVHTIEADEKLYLAAKHWLNYSSCGDNKITCYNGNSAEIIPNLQHLSTDRCIFFLDAHYSTGITSKEYGICPLLEELFCIYTNFSNPVVIIDDIRCMSSPGYPSIEEICARIPRGMKIEIRHDQMIILN